MTEKQLKQGDEAVFRREVKPNEGVPTPSEAAPSLLVHPSAADAPKRARQEAPHTAERADDGWFRPTQNATSTGLKTTELPEATHNAGNRSSAQQILDRTQAPIVHQVEQPDQGAKQVRKRRRAKAREARLDNEIKSIPETAAPMKLRVRHAGLLAAFFAIVILPLIAVSWYLWNRAVDQYASEIGFTVRTEDVSSAVDLLGGLTSLSRSSASDADILYEYIQSQELVRSVDESLNIQAMYSAHYDVDPIFSYNRNGSIEDLTRYWRKMVQISFDSGTGLLDVRVLAFTPKDAQLIAREIFSKSSKTVNELSVAARRDATRYALEELETAVERLKDAREAMTTFRSRNRLVDPSADIQSQMGLLTTLQQQLAAALIEKDLLEETARSDDPRMAQADRRIAVINRRIDEEREKFGTSGQSVLGEDYPTLVAEYERLSVDREFAEMTYTAALTAYDSARAQAQRQSRYLAAYVGPTLAEKAEYPRKWTILAIFATFLLLSWAVLSLVFYSLRDRA